MPQMTPKARSSLYFHAAFLSVIGRLAQFTTKSAEENILDLVNH